MRTVTLPLSLLFLAACAAPPLDDTSDSADALQRFEPAELPARASCIRDESWVKLQGPTKLKVSRCEAVRNEAGLVSIEVRLEEGGLLRIGGIDPSRRYPQLVGPASTPGERPTLRLSIPLESGAMGDFGPEATYHELAEGPTSSRYARTRGSADLVRTGASQLQLVSYDLAF